MYQIKVFDGDLSWTDLGMAGVTRKVLHKDGVTGAMAVLTRMEAGASIPAHWHTRAEETVYVLDGDFVEDGESLGPGTYLMGAAGTVHGPHSTIGGCTVLTHFQRRARFQNFYLKDFIRGQSEFPGTSCSNCGGCLEWHLAATGGRRSACRVEPTCLLRFLLPSFCPRDADTGRLERGYFYVSFAPAAHCSVAPTPRQSRVAQETQQGAPRGASPPRARCPAKRCAA